MTDTILVLLIGLIYGCMAGLYFGARWSTENFKNYRKKVDKRNHK